MRVTISLFFSLFASLLLEANAQTKYIHDLEFSETNLIRNNNATYKKNWNGTPQWVAEAKYSYAPTIMYDEKDGKYKYWACSYMRGTIPKPGHPTPVQEEGDLIEYRESYTLDGLATAQPVAAFLASKWTEPLITSTFDYDHVCDPTIIREGDDFYLYYTGWTMQPGATNHIAVAKSTDGGRTFVRQNGGQPIISPSELPYNGYGVGQAAVTKKGNEFYLLYSYINAPYHELRVVKSTNPLFPIDSIQVVRGPGAVPGIQLSTIGNNSVDLAWNKSRNEFVVVENNTPILSNPGLIFHVNLHHFDQDFNYIQYGNYSTQGLFRFGEGVGILTNSRREFGRSFVNSRHEIILAGATVQESPGCDQQPASACWIRGPHRYVAYTEGIHGVENDLNLQGWSIGLYDPIATDHLFTMATEGSGWFSDLKFSGWTAPAAAGAQIFAGDFNGDDLFDWGVYNSNYDGMFRIRYSDGRGGFANESAWSWGNYVTAKVFTGDFNADGKWDVGLYNPNNGDGNFYINYGNGSGSFSGQTVWHWGVFGPYTRVFSGDFNGDGRWDVGLYNPNSDGFIFINYGFGSGQFGNQTSIAAASIPDAQVFTGDFNSDGFYDFGLFNVGSDGNFYIHYNDLFNPGSSFINRTVFNWMNSGQVIAGKFRASQTAPPPAPYDFYLIGDTTFCF